MARVFTRDQYGVLNLVPTAIAAVVIFVDLGLASASQRSYYDYSDEQLSERRVVLATAVATSLVASMVVASVVIIVGVGAIPIEPLALSLAVKTAALAAFVIGVWALRVVAPSEVAAIWSMARERVRPTQT